MVSAVVANAITYTYTDLNKQAGTCTLEKWGGKQPTSGKLTLKETYTKDDVTYKVTKIASHALDNLTEVTEITIPANVIYIGSYDADGGATDNFFNCTKLAKFKVAAGSKHFSATAEGLLMTKDGKTIIRVPQALVTDGGAFNMSVNVRGLSYDAFAGNSTITTIALSPNLFGLYTNYGFNQMTSLKSFSFNGGSAGRGMFDVINGVLFDDDKTRIVSFPVRKEVPSYDVPASVTCIGADAFRNTTYLYRVGLGISSSNVTTIEARAFMNSGVTEAFIPSSVSMLGDQLFMGAPHLRSIDYHCSAAIPDDFARECPMLEKVTLVDKGIAIYDNAFRKCPKLTSFPFSIKTVMCGDSVFAESGFKEVVFEKAVLPAEDVVSGYDIFVGNKELEVFDMSKISVVEGSSRFSFELRYLFDCPALKILKLPPYISFFGADGVEPTFGINTPLTHVEMGAFYLSGADHVPLHFTKGVFTPEIYMKTTDALVESWPLANMFKVDSPATFKPTIYCERFTMETEESTTDYIVPGAKYYIPGGTSANYSGARAQGCTVVEMFNFREIGTDGKFSLNLAGNIGNLTIDRVLINDNTDAGVPGAGGELRTDIPQQDVNTVVVEYTVNSVKMKTRYVIDHKSSIDTVEDTVGAGLGFCLSGRMLGFGMDCDYSVADMAGRVVTAGHASSADLSGLSNGIYVVSATTADGGRRTTTIRI